MSTLLRVPTNNEWFAGVHRVRSNTIFGSRCQFSWEAWITDIVDCFSHPTHQGARKLTVYFLIDKSIALRGAVATFLVVVIYTFGSGLQLAEYRQLFALGVCRYSYRFGCDSGPDFIDCEPATLVGRVC